MPGTQEFIQSFLQGAGLAAQRTQAERDERKFTLEKAFREAQLKSLKSEEKLRQVGAERDPIRFEDERQQTMRIAFARIAHIRVLMVIKG